MDGVVAGDGAAAGDEGRRERSKRAERGLGPGGRRRDGARCAQWAGRAGPVGGRWRPWTPREGTAGPPAGRGEARRQAAERQGGWGAVGRLAEATGREYEEGRLRI
ncbi:hypothetical protein GCM10017779_18150 [Streptomyces capillispiralis]|nr:hypothetical protein GCM10017779_18150 [Streptomyces capillispiralis]